MNERLIESSKQLVALFNKHADDPDLLADARGEPERSHYRSKAEASRFEAMVASGGTSSQ